ncbi:MAG TPA: trehalose-phosphatase [Gemmatimonadaceae bacterium]
MSGGRGAREGGGRVAGKGNAKGNAQGNASAGAGAGAPPGMGGALDAIAALAMLDARLARAPRLLAFDVDGTLAPIVSRPRDAAVPEPARASLRRLAAGAGNHLAFVSGRAAPDAREMVGIEGAWYLGNHGFEWITPAGEARVAEGARRWLPCIADAAADAASLAGRIPGVTVEDKRWTLSVHWRNADAAVLPRLCDLLGGIAARSGLRLTEGKRVFELRPPLAVDKGTALLDLARELPEVVRGDDASLLYAGDDATDEDAFRALRAELPGAATVRVLGNRGEDVTPETAAELVLPSVTAMHELLEGLAGRFGG